MSDNELRRLARIAAASPTQENLARLGAAYLRSQNKSWDLVIEARRWFSKKQGSTYHRVSVYLNGEFLGRSRITYGYGSHYEQTGMELAVAEGNLPPPIGAEALRQWARRVGINLRTSVVDVGRKSDL